MTVLLIIASCKVTSDPRSIQRTSRRRSFKAISRYHATIETGLTPGTQTLEKAWASGWLFGLIPPSTVETASRCPNGVARVETQLSFVNQLVSFITLGIYTPMSIQVTCAGPGTAMDEAERSQLMIKEGANLEEKQRAIRDAAELSAKEGQPVLIKFE